MENEEWTSVKINVAYNSLQSLVCTLKRRDTVCILKIRYDTTATAYRTETKTHYLNRVSIALLYIETVQGFKLRLVDLLVDKIRILQNPSHLYTIPIHRVEL